jgi:hypothetical protein
MSVAPSDARRKSILSSGRGRLGTAAVTVLFVVLGTFVAAPAWAASYTKIYSILVSGRTITLWHNDSTGAYHTELSNGIPGDQAILRYDGTQEGPPYSTATATIGSGGYYVNTSDHVDEYADACGNILGVIHCTKWIAAG